MGWIESLQKAISYIEENITEELTIGEIAKVASASVHHFQRTFSILTDTTVGEYIRRRRLSLAAEALQRTKIKIIDVAFKYGYDSPEAFSKAFRKQHGCSPRDVHKQTYMLHSYNRLSIQLSLKGVEPMNYKIIEKPSFQAVGIHQSIPTANTENLTAIPKMWEDAHASGLNDALLELNQQEEKTILGICLDDVKQTNQHIDYWIATAYDGLVPPHLMSIEIPASKWAVFEVRGPMPHAIQTAWQKIITEWFPSHGYEHAGTAELEVYSHNQADHPDYYSEIWIPIK